MMTGPIRRIGLPGLTLAWSLLAACFVAGWETTARPGNAGPRLSSRKTQPGGSLDKPRGARARLPADYAEHCRQLRQRLGARPGLHIVVQEPFVVIGDEPADTVERRGKQTIQWAVDRLKQEYFPRDPREIIDIWLFQDKTSYERHTRELFGQHPSTPFGYYSPQHRALVMNISTGGGTLVHELVHPFVAANFPRCPAWFNEGLASLYEQCGDEGGRIRGYPNWRLRGLQQAIAAGRLGSFARLCSTTSREFYGDDRGTNYAQARYLCYYLQEQDLLAAYYHAFRRGVDEDPSGYRTLRETLGSPDMEQFQQDWESFILRLRF
jgi:hypothetical protein